MRTALLALALATLAAPAAWAQCRGGNCPTRPAVAYYRTSTPYYQTPAPYYWTYAPAYAPTPTYAAPAPSGDTYGFGAWLNAVRARHGRLPLAFDAGLAQDATINSSRGFGHSHMGRATRQDVGKGAGPAVWALWDNPADPAHQQALLDPTATSYGIACVGDVWTFNCR